MKSAEASNIPIGKAKLWLIFGLFTMLYLSGSRFNLDGYEMEYVLSARNIYHGNGPALSPGFIKIPGVGDIKPGEPKYPRQNFLQSYISVPFYALGAVLFGENPTIPGAGYHWELPWGPVLAVALINPAASAGTIILVILLSSFFGLSARNACRTGLIYGICSMAWVYAGLGLENFQTFFLTAGIYSLLRLTREKNVKWLAISSIFMMFLPNCKKYSALFILPMLVYFLISLRGSSFKFKVTALFIVFLGLSLGFAGVYYTYSIKSEHHTDYGDHLTYRFFEPQSSYFDTVHAVTLSPGKGLFWFNPFLFYAVAGWIAFRKAFKVEFAFFLSIIALLLVGLLRIPYVLIDEEWGPRYLHAVLPLMVVSGAHHLTLLRHGWRKILFRSVVFISAAIQTIGIFFFGFIILDTGHTLGYDDVFSMVFVPSRSQIYIGSHLFASMVNRYITGNSLLMEATIFEKYSGMGAPSVGHTTTLKGFDQPVGAFFTLRWVVAEMGHSVPDEYWMLVASLTCSTVLILSLITIVNRCRFQ